MAVVVKDVRETLATNAEDDYGVRLYWDGTDLLPYNLQIINDSGVEATSSNVWLDRSTLRELRDDINRLLGEED